MKLLAGFLRYPALDRPAWFHRRVQEQLRVMPPAAPRPWVWWSLTRIIPVLGCALYLGGLISGTALANLMTVCMALVVPVFLVPGLFFSGRPGPTRQEQKAQAVQQVMAQLTAHDTLALLEHARRMRETVPELILS